MNVHDLPNYGKDILTMTEGGSMPLRKKLQLLGPILGYLRSTVRELGVRETYRLIFQARQEVERAETLDWSDLKGKGISEAHLHAIIRKIALAKVLADKLGLGKAVSLRQVLSQQISVPVFEEMFAPADVFLDCGNGDFLPPFKAYYTSMMDAMGEKGLEEAIVIEDTPDTFELHVTYCAWAEVAKRLGNGAYCAYSTCYGDEVYFPELCRKAGFSFQRTGTLASGSSVCDFRFTRNTE